MQKLIKAEAAASRAQYHKIDIGIPSIEYLNKYIRKIADASFLRAITSFRLPTASLKERMKVAELEFLLEEAGYQTSVDRFVDKYDSFYDIYILTISWESALHQLTTLQYSDNLEQKIITSLKNHEFD